MGGFISVFQDCWGTSAMMPMPTILRTDHSSWWKCVLSGGEWPTVNTIGTGHPGGRSGFRGGDQAA